MKEMYEKAIEWLVGGDTGISSKTMCAALFDKTPAHFSMPYDASDFGRCLRFIRFMPDGAKDVIFENLSAHEEWKTIGVRWDELVALYDQERWNEIYDTLTEISKLVHPTKNKVIIPIKDNK